MLPDRRQVAVVPSEEFVAAVARQRNSDLVPGKLAQDVGRQAGRVTARLVESARYEWGAPERLGRQFLFSVIGDQALRHTSGEASLRIRASGEAEREGAKWGTEELRRHGHDERGIHAAGQKGAQRHVAHESPSD